MKTAGRVILLLIIILFLFPVIKSLLVVVASFQHPFQNLDAPSLAIGAAMVPVAFLVFLIWAFRRLAPTNKKLSTPPPIPASKDTNAQPGA